MLMKMMPVRILCLWMAVSLVAAAGCGEDASPETTAAVNSPDSPNGREGGPSTAGATKVRSAADLQPVFATRGPSGVVPDKLVVEFEHLIAARDNRRINGETEIEMEPEVDGTWRFEERDRLVFSPAEPFEPGASFEVEISSIGLEKTVTDDEGQTDIEVKRLEPAKPWSHTWRMPEFEMVQMMTPSVVPGSGRVQVSLLFSAAVDTEEIDDYAIWRVNGQDFEGQVNYKRGEKSHIAQASFEHSAFSGETGYAAIEFSLAGGLPYDDTARIRAPATSEHKSVAFGEQIEIEHVEVEEAVDGHYLYFVCNDRAAGGEMRFYNLIGYRDFNLSQRCTPEADLIERYIEIEPEVDFELAPAAGGFQLRGDFGRDTYNVRLQPGLRTVDGGVLGEVVERQLEIGPRSSVAQIVGQGRYIPPEAWDNLAIRHRNVDELSVEVRHVRQENLVFWMTGYREDADQRTSDLVGKTTIRPGGPADEVATHFLDIGDIVGERDPGLYEISINGAGTGDAARLLLTDINLLAKRSAKEPDAKWSDEVFVWALDMHTSRPKPGVDVKLVRPSGYVMGRCKTNRLGSCRVEVSDEDVDPNAPFALIASKGGDVTYLDYSEVQTRVTGADTGGEPYLSPRPYEASVYGDRDMYRPADTAHFVGIIREHDQSAPEAKLPVEYELFDARGRKVEDGVVETSETGTVALDHELGDYSSTGRWRLRLLVGAREVTSYDFYVEEFVPERMEVEVESLERSFFPEDDAEFGVFARYLFGASADGSRVELRCRLEPKAFTPPGRQDYKFGPAAFEDEDQSSIDLGKASATIDEDDMATIACPETEISGAVGGEIIAHASVFEAGSGRTTDARASAWLHPSHRYLGLKADVSQVERDEPITVEGVVVDPEGNPVSDVDEVDLEFTHLVRNYSWYRNRNRGHHRRESRWQPVIFDSKTVEVEDGKFSVQVTPAEVRDGFAIKARAGEVESTLQLSTNRQSYWSRWWGRRYSRTPKPDDPTELDIEGPEEVQLDKPHEIHFDAPYKGKALVTLETHRVIDHALIDVEPGQNSWAFSLSEQVPNVYATVFLIKDPHLDSKMAFLPERAFGVKSLEVDRSPYRHALEVETPDEVEPNSRLEVVVDAGELSEPMHVTVAAVDEGILQLNNYESPDPLDGLIAKRALGVNTFDTVGWNVQMPMAGQSGPPGGGSGGSSEHTGRIMPVEPVALWSGVVELPKSGRKTIALDVPQYRGELRVMAVGTSNSRVGTAEAAVKVRDPLTIQTTTPRFLTSGDTFEVPVFLTNTTGSDQEVEVSIDSEGVELPSSTYMEELLSPVAFDEAKKTKQLADGESKRFVFRAETLAVSGGARFEVTASAEGFVSRDEAKLPIKPADPTERTVETIELNDGTVSLANHVDGWVPHSERSTFWVSSMPYGESFDHLKFLVRYPHGCVEQTSSTLRPMVFLSELMQTVDPEGAYSKEEIDRRVMHGVRRILSMQTNSGGFAYWPGRGSPSTYGTVTATHLLLNAKKAGYEVPQERLDDALDWLRGQVDRTNYRWANGYMHYVLAMTGRANKGKIRRALDHYDTSVRGYQAEQVYLLKAALHMAGDRRYEDDLKKPDLGLDSGERESSRSFYSDFRRKGFQLNVFVDVFGRDKAGQKLVDAVVEGLETEHYGRRNTQELTWAITGLGKWVRTGSNNITAELEAGGKEVKRAVDGSHGVSWTLARAADYDDLELTVDTSDDKPVYLVISSEGVRRKPTVEYGGDGLELEREYLDDKGSKLDEDGHHLGDVAFVRLTLRNTSGHSQENVALVDRIPAGWEIENPRNSRGRYDKLYTSGKWQTDHLDVRDDQLAAFGSLGNSESRQVVYPVRATMSGNFTIPGAHAESMYRSDVWAREKKSRITVKGPWSGLVD
ncbi:MAG: alpha-2-macroglobulin family protein [Persicimonas sp.]